MRHRRIWSLLARKRINCECHLSRAERALRLCDQGREDISGFGTGVRGAQLSFATA